MVELPTKKLDLFLEAAKYIVSAPLYEFSLKTGYVITKPISFAIYLSSNCNLNCPFCYAVKDQMLEKFTLEDVLKIVDRFSDWGVKQVTLTGGEPLLFGGLYDLLKHIKEKGMSVGFSTNGVLWSEAFIKDICKIGVDRVSISIDGLEKTHDEIRGKGTFKKAVKTLEKLSGMSKKYGSPRLIINTIILDQNIEELAELFFLAKRYNASLNLMPLTLPENTDMFNKRERKLIEKRFWVKKERLALLEKKLDEIKQLKIKYGCVLNFDTFLELLKSYYRNPNKNHIDCKKGVYDFSTIFPNGLFAPCFLTGAIGNLKNEEPKKIWFSKKYSKVVMDMKGCKKCLANCYYTPTYSDLLKDFLIYPILRKVRIFHSL